MKYPKDHKINRSHGYVPNIFSDTDRLKKVFKADQKKLDAQKEQAKSSKVRPIRKTA